MRTYIYHSNGTGTKDVIFHETGFSKEGFNCYYCGSDSLLYFTPTRLNQLMTKGIVTAFNF